MKITLQKSIKWTEGEGDIVLPLFEGEDFSRVWREAPEALREEMARITNKKNFSGKFGEVHISYASKEGVCYAVLGLGVKKEFELHRFGQAVGVAVTALQNKSSKNILVAFSEMLLKESSVRDLCFWVAKSALVASYRFHTFQSKAKKENGVIEGFGVCGIPAKEIRYAEEGFCEGEIVGNAVNSVREYGNLPSNHATPQFLVSRAKEMGERYKKLSVNILHKEDLERLGMGGILGVSKGSSEEPALIVLEWKGGTKSEAPVCLVGKAITFDSGGISLKPRDKMDEMKFDMSGGGTVLGTLEAVAALGLKKNIVGLVPTCENMPGGNSYKPGDILTTYNGKTIEVLDTDAEGRVILSDALGYAQTFKPKAVVDLATLTGACLVALGTNIAGMMGNNDKLKDKVRVASRATGERVWELPLPPEATEAVKSDVADVRNITPGFPAGAIAGGAFLQEFTDYPWVHLDIAGTAWDMTGKPWRRKGATGEGVHLLVEFLKK